MPAPLLADWFQGIVGLLVVAFWVLRAFMEAKGNQAKQAREPNVLEVNPNDVDGDDPVLVLDEAEAERGAVRAEGAAGERQPWQSRDSGVDEFLRRLEQQREAGPQSPTAPDQPRDALGGRELPTGSSKPSQRQFGSQKPRSPRKPAANMSQSVGEHVSQHIGHLEESRLAENSAHLGEAIAGSDDRMAARLHQKFDHKLGNLGARDARGAEIADQPSVPNSADSVAEMLANPDGVRNAIILNEVLQRPSERW